MHSAASPYPVAAMLETVRVSLPVRSKARRGILAALVRKLALALLLVLFVCDENPFSFAI